MQFCFSHGWFYFYCFAERICNFLRHSKRKKTLIYWIEIFLIAERRFCWDAGSKRGLYRKQFPLYELIQKDRPISADWETSRPGYHWDKECLSAWSFFSKCEVTPYSMCKKWGNSSSAQKCLINSTVSKVFFFSPPSFIEIYLT